MYRRQLYPEKDNRVKKWLRTSERSALLVGYEHAVLEKEYRTEDGRVYFKTKIRYPIFEGGSKSAAAINAFYEQWLNEKRNYLEGGTNSPVWNAHHFFVEEGAETPHAPWSYTDTMEDVKFHGDYLSVLHNSYEYTGGAHGNPGRENYIFRIRDGKRMGLADIIGITEEDANQKIVSGFLHKMEEIGKENFFSDAQKTIEGKTIQNTGSYFSDAGIVFYMPPYEAGPYSLGYVEITIPYEDLGM